MGLVIAAGLSLRVRNEDRAVEVLDAEWGIALGELRISEGPGPHLIGERVVEDVDLAVVEVGGIEVLLRAGSNVSGADREALVDGAIPGMVVPDLGRRTKCGPPAADDAGLATEQEAVAV